MKRKVWRVLIVILIVEAIVLSVLLFIDRDERRSSEKDRTNKYSEIKGLEPYFTPDEHIVIDGKDNHDYVDNEILITVADGFSESDVGKIVQDFGGTIKGKNEYLNTYQVVLEKPRTYSELKKLEEELSGFEEILRADINYFLRIEAEDYSEVQPNDEKWRNQWHDTPDGNNWGMEAIHAPKLWGIMENNRTYSINVGVLDSQFYTEHEDLKFNDIYLNEYKVHRDSSNHGTFVCGIIAAVHNDKGVAGILPDTGLYCASMDGLKNRGVKTDVKGITVSNYEAGFVYLIVIKGCKVVNLSYGGGLDVYEDYEEIKHMTYSLKNLLHEGYDFLIVKAAGNDRTSYEIYDEFSLISDQEVLDRILTVGAAELFMGKIYIWDKSNYGDTVDLIAPGHQICSTICRPHDWSPFGLFGWHWYEFISDYDEKGMGTSYAAPHATGTAAAIWMLNPELTGAEVKDIMCKTAQGSYGYKSIEIQPTVEIWDKKEETLKTYVIKDHDKYMKAYDYHYPMLDAERAAMLALEYKRDSYESQTKQKAQDEETTQESDSYEDNEEWWDSAYDVSTPVSDDITQGESFEGDELSEDDDALEYDNSSQDDDFYEYDDSPEYDEVPEGSYTCYEYGFIKNTFTFYGDHQITMNALGVEGKGTYEIKNDELVIHYTTNLDEYFGRDKTFVWSVPFEIGDDGIYIYGERFYRE